MINIVFDPFKIIIDIVEKRWPHVRCDVYFARLDDYDKGKAFTLFVDGSDDVEIFIDPRESYEDCVEGLAHELAHVVLGKNYNGRDGKGHGPEWFRVFTIIYNDFCKIADGIDNIET